jgi:hypothetical protein
MNVGPCLLPPSDTGIPPVVLKYLLAEIQTAGRKSVGVVISVAVWMCYGITLVYYQFNNH